MEWWSVGGQKKKNGVVEWWSIGVLQDKKDITPVLHYSNTPILRYIESRVSNTPIRLIGRY
jgi:hypothetical protein